jgi:hypothetical protein
LERNRVLTPSRTAHDIVQERGEGKEDGAGAKRCQPGRDTLDCQEKNSLVLDLINGTTTVVIFTKSKFPKVAKINF